MHVERHGIIIHLNKLVEASLTQYVRIRSSILTITQDQTTPTAIFPVIYWPFRIRRPMTSREFGMIGG